MLSHNCMYVHSFLVSNGLLKKEGSCILLTSVVEYNPLRLCFDVCIRYSDIKYLKKKN